MKNSYDNHIHYFWLGFKALIDSSELEILITLIAFAPMIMV
jgi:hypothetical protein